VWFDVIFHALPTPRSRRVAVNRGIIRKDWIKMALQMSVGVGFEKKMALRSPPGPPYAAHVAVWMGMSGEK